jgi:hypothetical protein
MTFKERVEENVAIWLLGSLLTGFLSGIAAYRGLQEIMDLVPVSKSGYETLQEKAQASSAHENQLQNELATSEANVAQLQRDLSKAANAASASKTKGPDTDSDLVKFQELRGLAVRILYVDVRTSDAVEIKAKLEKLGIQVDFRPSSASSCPSCVAGMIEYTHSKDASAAVELKSALSAYGFNRVQFHDCPNCDYAMLILVW